MIAALPARWLLTAVFAAAGLGPVLLRRDPAGLRQPADRVSVGFCAAMCAALTAMTWWAEPAATTWMQAALFGCVTIWLALASLADSDRVRRPSLPALLHTLMAGAMTWMLTAMPAGTEMPSAGPGRGMMAPMSRAATPTPVLAVTIVFAVSCAAAALPWLAWAIGSGPRVKNPVSASQAAMSAGMAAMLFAAW